MAQAEPILCPICAEERPHLRVTGCCTTAICSGCIETLVLTKADAASELVARYLDNAHQCPQCGHGPVEHFACSDLTAHDVGFNKCPSCSFQANSIRAWPRWNGQLPDELMPRDGCFDCPFCRAASRLDEMVIWQTTMSVEPRWRLRAASRRSCGPWARTARPRRCKSTAAVRFASWRATAMSFGRRSRLR
eukprot:SAG11_NODE_6815_length_1242_cov_1.487314_2_plen_190_part_01